MPRVAAAGWPSSPGQCLRAALRLQMPRPRHPTSGPQPAYVAGHAALTGLGAGRGSQMGESGGAPAPSRCGRHRKPERKCPGAGGLSRSRGCIREKGALAAEGR